MAKLLYSLRPSKYVERLMIVDACRRLGRIAPVYDYHYIGFGGLEFMDFDLVHRHLGIKEMTSIEQDDTWVDRYRFNRPFNGIEILFGTATQHLPLIRWDGLKIVWLDYEVQLTASVVSDCETVLRAIQPGSVLIVTVNAQAQSGKRMETLAGNLGDEVVPNDLDEQELTGEWEFARVQRQILTERIMAVANLRVPPVTLRQFLNFNYKDGPRMATFGWFVSSVGLDQVLTESKLEEHEASRTGEKSLVIKVPVLTRRELEYLNQRLPLEHGGSLDESWLDQSAQGMYANLYRWYPTLA